MLAAIASLSVQSLAITQADPARTPALTDPMVGTQAQRVEHAQRAEHAHHAAAAAALAPAAMSALLCAQEYMAADSTALSRARTVREIDHVITRVTGAPSLAVTSAGADFSLAKLMAARQQLRETFA